MTEVKMIGTSSNGSMRCRIRASYWSCVLLSFSMRSHLFITTTMPFLLRAQRLKMLRSCASKPVEASHIKMQTSLFSMARMARITE